MAGFTIRCNGDKVYQLQLRLLAQRREQTVAEMVRTALDLTYGEELSALYKTAIFVASGGHSENHNEDTQPGKGHKS